MPEERDREFLIDAALATYADPGPNSDLAERILHRLEVEPAPSPRFRWLPWAIALPVAFCVLLLVHSELKVPKLQTGPRTGQADQTVQLGDSSVVGVRPHSGTTPAPETAQQGKRRQSKLQQIMSSSPNSHSHADAAVSEPLPKLDVFPTPEPLSSQEHALADFVAHTPQSEQQALAQSEQLDAPLTVASIHVMPIESPDEGGN